MLPNIAALYTTTLAPLPCPVTRVYPIYAATSTTTTDETTSTFAGFDFLEPHPKRIVIVTAYHGVAAAATCTVNGINSYFRAQTTTHEFSLFAVKVPASYTGMSGVVTVSATGSVRKAVSVYVAYPRNHMPLDSGTATANTTGTATISNLKVQAGGFLIFAGGQHGIAGTTVTVTWNGTDAITTDVNDGTVEALSRYDKGRIIITNSTDLSDLSLTTGTSGTKRLVAATWGPTYK